LKYVIIGNSAAGIGGVEGIRKTDKESEITIISSEPHHTYSRPLISRYLQGKLTEKKLNYRPNNFYSQNKCEFVHDTVTGIDVKFKQIVLSGLSKHKSIAYDRLLISTGSMAMIPMFTGIETVENKFTFISLNNAKTLEAAVNKNNSVLIVGAGMVGLKCAEAVSGLTGQVTVLDSSPQILPNILDKDGAKFVQKHIEKQGIKFILNTTVKHFDRKNAVLENNGKIDFIDFDMLVLAAGVRPNTALIEGHAKVDNGIIVTDKCETAVQHVYAAGGCTGVLGVPNSYMQGFTAGFNMANPDGKPIKFADEIPMTSTDFFGLRVVAAGKCNSDTAIRNSRLNYYKKFFHEENTLKGYILIGDTSSIEGAGIYTGLIREQRRIDDFPSICKNPFISLKGV